MKIKLVIVGLGIILAIKFYFFYQNQAQYKDGQEISFVTTLLSETKIVGSQQIFTANLGSNQRVRIITSLYPKYYYGDSLKVSGTLKIKLLNENTFHSIYFPKITVVKNDSNFLGVVGWVRQKLISLFSESLPSPLSSLMLGIIFGIKIDMPKDFTENLRTAGVMHVIAASGMNVTMIGGFLSSLFALFLKRQLALILTISGIMFYCLLGGLEASIVRASVMGILVFSAQILGKQKLAVYSLFLAGFVMLFLSPNLIFDIGFQLSFTATLGILYIKPLFENQKTKRPLTEGGIKSDVLTTIAAQLSTLPILLSNFGIYSLWSILVNALVLWTVPIIMAVGGVGAIVGFIFQPFGQLMIYLSMPLLLYFEKIVNIFGKIGGVISIESLSWQIILGYYLVLVSLIVFLKRKISAS